MPAPIMTTDLYLRTPETRLPQELIYGCVREAAASPTPGHQAFVGAFYLALLFHVRDRGLGGVWMAPLDVIFDRERALVLQPDLIFVSAARRDIVTDRVWAAPDMVLEVLSPNPRLGRLDERVAWFAEYGVGECWLVHQYERQVAVLSLARGGVRERLLFDEHTPIRTGLFPDFHQSLSEILAAAATE